MHGFVELGNIERFVLAHWMTSLDPWLEHGFVKTTGERVAESLFSALHYVRPHQVESIWSSLFDSPAPHGADLWELTQELSERTRAPSPSIVVLERRIERGFFAPSAPKREGTPQPQRTETDHYVIVQALDPDGQPASGVRLELLIAGGEVRTTQTGADGNARVERIQAGSVVIRVLDIDSDLWRPLDGSPSQPSSQDASIRWHKTKRGECLSKIAHRYGLKGWKAVWDHPKNQSLREKRKSPHVLVPGDQIAVPGVRIHEIVRSTDATHRIELTEPMLQLKVILGDHNGRPYKLQPYELRYTRDPDEEPVTGTTGGAGEVEQLVLASAEQVSIHLPDLELAWPVTISAVPQLPEALDEDTDEHGVPNEELTRAVQARLNALGIASGLTDGVWDDQTRLAVLQLRRAHGTASNEPLCSDDLNALKSYGV